MAIAAVHIAAQRWQLLLDATLSDAVAASPMNEYKPARTDTTMPIQAYGFSRALMLRFA